MSRLLSYDSSEEYLSLREKLLSELLIVLSLVVVFYGLNAIEPLFRPDDTETAYEELLLIASSLRRLNCSLVLIGAD